MSYQPIEHYGVIGDMRTVALVGLDGSIDWMCYPHFDSPSVFAAILDDDKGGRFDISPLDMRGVRSKQFYWPDTNVLVTRFLSPDGVGEITDFMPINAGPTSSIVRFVSAVRRSIRFEVQCRPAFNYARDSHDLKISEQSASFHTKDLSLSLSTRVPLKADGRGGVEAEFVLSEGQTATFVLQGIEEGTGSIPVMPEPEARVLFERTVNYWRRWISQCTYQGRWREKVQRSALALKLLTYEPTGAMVAAPTCSLPESIGGERNWDYRYTWLRDAAFTIYGLLRIGFTEEAEAFMNWLETRCMEPSSDGSLQLVYRLDGSQNMTEQTLDHLEGYRSSRPVRIGNGAHSQLQLDIYGELLDAVYLFNKYGSPISYELWTYLRRLIDWVGENWQQPDEGIWEIRSERRQFVYSKLMCWVALDRGLRLADRRSFPADREGWLRCRDRIYEEIHAKGWSEERQSFVQSFGGDSLDAANLIMPLVFFMSPTDPRMLKTLDAIYTTPSKGGLTSNSLVYRYNVGESPDGLSGEEGSFNICTFWLVEAMTRAGQRDPRRLQEARLIFERMLGYANHLDLYAEETGASGEALGNFPQAFTHLSLISAAYNLDRALTGRRSP